MREAHQIMVHGMTCGSCLSAVTKCFEGNDSIDQVFVNLESEAAYLISKEGRAFEKSDISKSLNDVGFEASVPSEKEANRYFGLFFSVEGMTCKSCESTVRSFLISSENIQKIEGNLKIIDVPYINAKTGRTFVVFEATDNSLSDKKCIEILEKLDFSSTLLSIGFYGKINFACKIENFCKKSLNSSEKPKTSGSKTAPSFEEKVQIAPENLIFASVLIEIDGMTCASCVRSIENASNDVFGVLKTEVSLPLAQARIDFDAGKTGLAEIIRAIESAGYGTNVVPEDKDNDAAVVENVKRRELREEKAIKIASARLAFSLIFSIPLMVIAMVGGHNMFGGLFSVSQPKSAINKPVKENHIDLDFYENVPIISEKRYLRGSYAKLEVRNEQFSAKRKLLGEQASSLGAEIFYGFDISSLLQWMLATLVQFGSGWIFYKSALKDIKRRTLTMNFLIAAGTSSAYLYSVLLVILGIAKGKSNSNELFFDTSGMLISFILLGKLLELIAKRGANDAISKLMSLRADSAILMPNWPDTTKEKEVDAKNLVAGDVVKLIRGAKVPADGMVIQGSVSINESMLTGESMPVTKKDGGEIIGSTIVEEGFAFARITRTGSDSSLSQIILMVQKAQGSKPPIQDVGDRVSAVFVPLVLVIGLVTFVVWLTLTSIGLVPEHWYRNLPTEPNSVLFSFMFALSVLVIACPCAVGLASPMAVVVGMGVGASNGVLIKGSAALQKAAGVTAVVFDKTGTLTQGSPQVSDVMIILPKNKGKKPDPRLVMSYIASVERASEHPLAKALISYSDSIGLSKTYFPVVDGSFKPESGKGISCKISEGKKTKEVSVGSPSFIKSVLRNSNGQYFSNSVNDIVNGLEGEGKTAICASVDGKMMAVIGISDKARPEASQVVEALQKKGIDVWMVTGDNLLTAQSMAKSVKIKPEFVMAEVLPGNKADKVKELQQNGNSVIMVGDGINDAPALAQADVGIAIGGGTDIAMESADMVLMRGKLQDVLTSISLSKTIFNRIKINFAWAFMFNCLGIPFAAGVFFPLLRRTVPPILAGFAMALSSVSVCLSSLLLKLYRPPHVVRKIDQKKVQLTADGYVDSNLTVKIEWIDPNCNCLCCKSCSTKTLLRSVADRTSRFRNKKSKSVGSKMEKQDDGSLGVGGKTLDEGNEGDCPSCKSCGKGAEMVKEEVDSCQCRCSRCSCKNACNVNLLG